MSSLLTLPLLLLTTLNPGTGDRNHNLMIIVIAALVISAALIVALALSSKRNKRK